MIGRADDILQLITQANTQPLTNNMGNPSSPSNYGQGQILTWNPATFENQISYRNGVLTNVPVLSGPDALTYQEGDIVAILSNAPNNGATVYWIGGRIIVPGPGRGAEAIAFLAGELGKAVSAAVFAERIFTATDITLVDTNGVANTWVDGSTFGTPDPGPFLDIEVGPSGTAIVWVGANIVSNNSALSRMSFLTTGATDRNEESARVISITNNATSNLSVSVEGVTVMTGLNTGPHRLTAKYYTTDATAGRSSWADRTMIAIAF